MRSAQGFTLIELLVVIAISSVILGVTVASYRSFQDRQELSQIGKSLISNLRFAQSQAFGGVKDCGTGTLIGWYARFSTGSYTINSRCGANLGTARVVTLPQGVTISIVPTADVLFQPINKNAVFVTDATTWDPLTPPLADTQATITLTSTRTSATFNVVVRKTGDIQ